LDGRCRKGRTDSDDSRAQRSGRARRRLPKAFQFSSLFDEERVYKHEFEGLRIIKVRVHHRLLPVLLEHSVPALDRRRRFLEANRRRNGGFGDGRLRVVVLSDSLRPGNRREEGAIARKDGVRDARAG
jgi:hypothetical protein